LTCSPDNNIGEFIHQVRNVMSGKFTMHDVARKAGVSKTTVSYVLSGKKKLTREIENRVLQAVQELDYRPKQAAPRLARPDKRLVSLCIPIEASKMSDDIYHLPLIEGAMDRAHKDGFQLVIDRISVNDRLSEQAFYRNLEIVDGVILANPRKDHVFDSALKKDGIPYVIYGTPEKGELDSLFYLDVDLVGAGFQAVQYMFENGRQKLFYVNLPEALLQTQHRLDGYKLAHREAGIPWKDEKSCFVTVNLQEAYRKTKEVLKQWGNEIDGFVAANDILAMGVVRALHDERIAIPQKVAVIGMGSRYFSEFGYPRLTTVDFSPYRCGYEATKMLIEIITRRRIRPSHLLVPGHLVRGETA
jgi:DNA-binding LacI/PurR family transcriptional regulator